MVGPTVLDRKLLAQLFAAMVGSLSTVFSVVLALKEPPAAAAGASCALDATQRGKLEEQARLLVANFTIN